MKREHIRAYRALRSAWALLKVLPRYVWLLAREQFARSAAPQAAWDRAHAAAAAEMKAVALSLAGAFTKAAQIGGARADVLPQAFIDELSQFHDAVPPRPFDTLRGILERNLGRPVAEVFATFDEHAVAAASLAQVHRATLHDGTRVAVKIQYPEIRRLIPLDLHVVRAVASLTRWFQRRIDLRSLAHEVTRNIELELDFRREAASTRRLRTALEKHTEVVVPKVYDELCGDDSLVLEWLDGIQITRTDALRAAGHSPADAARKVGDLYGLMIFEQGFFHGDPHPGNLLVLPSGQIGLLDFGLCKELPPQFAHHTAHMIVSALIGDTKSALSAADKLGFDIQATEPEHLRAIFLLAVGDSDGDATLLEMLDTTRVRRIPEDFALVIRTLVLLNGLSHRLAPGRRLIQAKMLEHLATGAAHAAAEVA